MISVVRLHSEKESGGVWDAVMAGHEEMNARLGGRARIFYATQRMKYGDVSLFVHTDEADGLGDFVTEEVSRISSVDGVWVFQLIKPRFFPIPKETLADLPRYTIVTHVLPSSLRRVYTDLCQLPPLQERVVTYVAYTFRSMGESIICSMLAKDKKQVNQVKSKVIEAIPGVLRTEAVEIANTRRLLPREEWENYAKVHPRSAGA